jgi:16S rRNA pseudouridine516 synthase
MRVCRLDQVLSRCGYCSRAEARRWVRAGRVTVDGAPAGSAEEKIDPLTVRVDGEPLECPEGILALWHKPAGCVCSRDTREGPTIYDLLPARWSRRHPPVTSIGRLDKDTTGVLLLTDVGELVQRWTSPRRHVVKVYEVTLDRDLDPALVGTFASGELRLPGEDRPCRPAKLQLFGARQARLELVEGRFHQVKRMFGSQGCAVMRLHRSRFGPFELGDLAPGQWQLLSVAGFRAASRLDPASAGAFPPG